MWLRGEPINLLLNGSFYSFLSLLCMLKTQEQNVSKTLCILFFPVSLILFMFFSLPPLQSDTTHMLMLLCKFLQLHLNIYLIFHCGCYYYAFCSRSSWSRGYTKLFILDWSSISLEGNTFLFPCFHLKMTSIGRWQIHCLHSEQAWFAIWYWHCECYKCRWKIIVVAG